MPVKTREVTPRMAEANRHNAKKSTVTENKEPASEEQGSEASETVGGTPSGCPSEARRRQLESRSGGGPADRRPGVRVGDHGQSI